MSTSKEKIIITGAAGFIGHHLITKFKERGYFVTGIDKRPIPAGHSCPDHFIQTDIFDLGYRDLMDTKFLVHLAFITNIPNSVRHPRETTYGNIDMTIHLLEYCKEAGIKKFLFPSTASLYSYNPTPWHENQSVFPIEAYSWQKLACEHACQMYSRVYKLPTVIFRFFQVFGEHQREDTALAAFLKAKAEGKPVTLTETTAQSTFRSGQRDFVYAGDVAEAICLALESDQTGNGEIFNVASGKVHTMEEIANAMKAKIIWSPRREYEVGRHEADLSKIRALGWEPRTDVIQWLSQHS